MLGKKKNLDQNIQGFISSGVLIRGTIDSREAIRVDGKVEGEVIIAGDLVVGEQGKIKGEVKVENLLLAGNVIGNVTAAEKVRITSSGSIQGDVSCLVLVVEEGGILSGSSKMILKDKTEGTITPAPEKKAT